MDATRTDHRQIVRTAVDAWNNRELQPLLDLYAEKWLLHPLFFSAIDSVTQEKAGSGREYTHDDLVKAWDYEWDDFPQQHREIDMLLEAGDDMVVSVLTVTRVRESGAKATFKEIAIDRIEDGKIVETWNMFDRLGYWQQFGLVPPTTELIAKLSGM